MKKNVMDEYDGMFFVPQETEEEEGLEFNFMSINEDLGEPIEGTSVGPMYHVAFFKVGEDGNYVFDEQFEAIFSDPVTYARGFIGHNVSATFVKKRQKSKKWFEEYLTGLIEACKIDSIENQGTSNG